jgi:hypothetical protein
VHLHPALCVVHNHARRASTLFGVPLHPRVLAFASLRCSMHVPTAAGRTRLLARSACILQVSRLNHSSFGKRMHNFCILSYYVYEQAYLLGDGCLPIAYRTKCWNTSKLHVHSQSRTTVLLVRIPFCPGTLSRAYRMRTSKKITTKRIPLRGKDQPNAWPQYLVHQNTVRNPKCRTAGTKTTPETTVRPPPVFNSHECLVCVTSYFMAPARKPSGTSSSTGSASE